MKKNKFNKLTFKKIKVAQISNILAAKGGTNRNTVGIDCNTSGGFGCYTEGGHICNKISKPESPCLSLPCSDI